MAHFLLSASVAMPSSQSPHDSLFKEAFSNPKDAAAQLKAVLPEGVARLLEFDTLVPASANFGDQELRSSYCDLLFRADCQGRPGYVYVLFEHKSEPDHWALFQILRYMVRIWERELSTDPSLLVLPPIIPVLLHHGEKGWCAPNSFHQLFDPALLAAPDFAALVPSFNVVLDDLRGQADPELCREAMSRFSQLVLLLLRDARRLSPVELKASLLGWAELLRLAAAQPDGQRAVWILFSYISRVAPDLPPGSLVELARQAIPETEEVVATLEQTLFEKGRNEGRNEGQRTLLLHLLDRKFGQPSPGLLSRVEAADESALARYAERVLFAHTIEEVLND